DRIPPDFDRVDTHDPRGGIDQIAERVRRYPLRIHAPFTQEGPELPGRCVRSEGAVPSGRLVDTIADEFLQVAALRVPDPLGEVAPLEGDLVVPREEPGRYPDRIRVRRVVGQEVAHLVVAVLPRV